MDEWISVKERMPNTEELEKSERLGFLCRVLSPEDGGYASKKTAIITYNILDKRWVCQGVIVTHWMPLPKPPEEQENGKHE